MRNFLSKLFVQVAEAQSGPPSKLVPDCGDGPCSDWGQLFQLFQNILNWFVWAAVPVATIALAYAGWLYMWGGTNPGDIAKAKGILKATLVGLIVVLGAALFVKTLLQFLAKDQSLQNFIN
jgi:hypothetical protein